MHSDSEETAAVPVARAAERAEAAERDADAAKADEIFARLDAVRARERRVLVLAALLRCGLALLGLVVAVVALDLLVVSGLAVGVERLVRLALLIAVLATVAWLAWRWVVRGALRADLDDENIALRLEARHPELAGRLISTVQFARADPRRWQGSRALIAALERQTVRGTRALDFADIIDARTLRRVALIAVAAAVPLAGLAAWRSDYAAAALARLLLAERTYPTACCIRAVQAPAAVGQGETATVEVELDPGGVLPAGGALFVRPAGGGAESRLDLLPIEGEPARLRATLERVLETIELRPVVHDASWPRWERLRVLARPVAVRTRVTITWPAYTGRAPTTADAPDIAALVGSQAKVEVAFSKPLASAELRIAGTGAATLGMAIAADGRSASAQFALMAPGTWQVMAVDTDGMSPADPPLHRIEALADAAPTVELRYPAADRLVTASARFPLRFAAVDDIAVAGAVLKYQTLPAGGDVSKAPVKELPIAGVGAAAAGAARERVDGEFVADLRALGGAPGARLACWIEVSDNRAPSPNTGRSATRVFTIGTDTEVRMAFDRERDEILRRVGQIAEQQREVQADTESLRREAQGGRK